MEKLSPLFRKVLFWLVFILLAFIPLYPKFPLFSVSGTFVAIRAEDVLIAILVVVWTVFMTASKKWEMFFNNRLTKALGLFLFIGALSIFSAIYITHTVTFKLSVLHYLRRVEYMILLPICYFALSSKKQLRYWLALFFIVVVLVNIYALGQRYLHFPVVSTTNSEFSKGLILYLTSGARVSSTFAGHYDLAIFLSMMLIAGAGLFFLIKRIWIKIVILMISLMSLVVLIMTAARVSFIAAIAGMMLYLFLIGKRMVVLLLIILASLILIYPSQLRDRLISTVTINLEKQGTRYSGSTEIQRQRSDFNIPTLTTKTSTKSGNAFESTESGAAADIVPGEPIDTTELGVYRSFGIRLNYEWPAAIRAFEKNPLLGTGYSSLGIATDNDLLRSLGEVGLMGTMAFVLIILVISKRFWKNIRYDNRFVRYISALGLSTIFGFLINSSFIDAFEASKVATLFWMILGICLSAVETI